MAHLLALQLFHNNVSKVKYISTTLAFAFEQITIFLFQTKHLYYCVQDIGKQDLINIITKQYIDLYLSWWSRG